MNFSSSIAKIGKGKFINGYKTDEGICLFLSNGGLEKKMLKEGIDGFILEEIPLINNSSEILQISSDIYVERSQSSVRIKSSV